mmetsp:Transcript_16970/g.56201  ORF Transcript_16970/g.56201 Transcript_16970/m.56201 type:complete len:492 (-) Transcript_16970:3864-5339(-)
MQSDVERIRRSPGDGPLGSSGLAVMLDNFRRSFDEETSEDKTMREVTTVPSTSEEDPNGNQRDVAGFSRINIPSYDGSVTQPVRDGDDAVDFEISRIASPAGSTLRFESQQFEELITANKKLREELQLAMDMKGKYEASVKEERSREARELSETKEAFSAFKEESRKMFEEMRQMFRSSEPDAIQRLPVKAAGGADTACMQNGDSSMSTTLHVDVSNRFVKPTPLVKFHSTDISRFNGEMTLEYSVASWFGELEFQFQRQRVPSDQQVDIATTLVGNRVRNWMLTLRGDDKEAVEHGPWKEFKKIMVAEYLPYSQVQSILNQISYTRQGSKEKINNFVDRFSSLANHYIACCMTAENEAEYVSTACTKFGLERHFVQNLSNEVTASFARKLLLSLEKENAGSSINVGSFLPELYREAKALSVVRSFTSSSQERSHVGHKTVNAINGKDAKPGQKGPEEKKSDRGPKCFLCGKYGHFKKVCPLATESKKSNP